MAIGHLKLELASYGDIDLTPSVPDSMIPTLQACAETEHDARLAHYRGTQALLNVMGINTDEHIAEDQQSTEQIITVWRYGSVNIGLEHPAPVAIQVMCEMGRDPDLNTVTIENIKATAHPLFPAALKFYDSDSAHYFSGGIMAFKAGGTDLTLPDLGRPPVSFLAAKRSIIDHLIKQGRAEATKKIADELVVLPSLKHEGRLSLDLGIGRMAYVFELEKLDELHRHLDATFTGNDSRDQIMRMLSDVRCYNALWSVIRRNKDASKRLITFLEKYHEYARMVRDSMHSSVIYKFKDAMHEYHIDKINARTEKLGFLTGLFSNTKPLQEDEIRKAIASK